MTVPIERTRSLVYAHAFLKDLLNPKITPRVPTDVRATAQWLLRHYPDPGTVQYAHNLCPVLFGPLPEDMPSRLDATHLVAGVTK